MLKSLKNKFFLFPFLFGLYPILALAAHNAAEMELFDGLRALISSFIFVLIINTILLILIKNPLKSALVTILFLFLFYSYGHINLIARSWSIFGYPIGRHRTLLPIYGLFFTFIAWLIIKTKRDLSGSVRFLNAFSVILLIFPFYQIITYQIGEFQAQRQRDQPSSETAVVQVADDITPPDVYYILVDGYPREDFIVNFLGSSNFGFLESLEERGFYVAHCSMSNYSDTRFSLASTLNMTYLDDGQNKPEVVFPGSILDSMIRSGGVQKNFSDLGYKIITFESGYKWLRWEASNLHLDPTEERKMLFLRGGLNGFEQLLLNTTAVKFILDIPYLINRSQLNSLENFVNNPRVAHRERVLFALDQLSLIPDSIPGPKLVYAHIIFPHPPFILDANGNYLQNSPSDELSAYADQISYLDQRLIEIIDKLIPNSDPKPIIIIQGDHGATIDYEDLNIDKANRLGILNAYYFPENTNNDDATAQDIYRNLYPEITPVNTFRVIFDQYFGGNFGLLADKSIIGKQSPYITINCSPTN